MKIRFNAEDAFTGLEAAIVLIAFVIVASVFSYVVLSSGFFTTQKAQQVVFGGVEQSSANLQMVGQVYGMNSGGAADTINLIEFTIGLGPGGNPMDLSKMSIAFSTDRTAPMIYSRKSGAVTSSDTNKFETYNVQTNAIVDSIKAQDQIRVRFFTSEILKNTRMTIEIRPAIGATLPFTRMTPARIEKMNILA
jgi:flagellin FlaB